MDIKPVTVKPLSKRHSFVQFKTKIARFKKLLSKVDERQESMSSAMKKRLLAEEAYYGLQNVKVDHSLDELLKNTHLKDKASLKFYNNYAALTKAYKMRKQPVFDRHLFCSLHKIIQKGVSLKPQDVGRLRTRQNWIGPEGCSLQEAYFFPPEASDVPKLLDELSVYLDSSKDDPIIKLALFFAQILIIHPFMDGNGRVARACVGLFLKKEGLLKFPLFGISEYLKKQRLKYFETLYLVTEKNDFEPWISFFLQGCIESAQKLLKKPLARI